MELRKWKELLRESKQDNATLTDLLLSNWELKELMFRLTFNDTKNLEMSISDTGKLIKKQIHQE